MSIRFFACVVLLASLFSCSEKKKEQPALSRDQMVELLIDIYLAEARTTLLPIGRDSAYRLFLPYQDSLMQKRGVSDSTVKLAYSYYLRHPTEFEEIYDAVIDSLSLREQRIRQSPQPNH